MRPTLPIILLSFLYVPYGWAQSLTKQPKTKASASCVGCHPLALTSTRVTDQLFTRGPNAAPCPLQTAPDAKTSATSMSTGIRAGLKFSHKLHAARDITCDACHRPSNSHAAYPKMSDCVSCHERSAAPTRCDACHQTTPSGQLKTQFEAYSLVPNERVLPHAAHDSDFVSRHGQVARTHPALCTTCHQEDQCQSCHLTRDRMTGIHPGDYLRMHSVEARHRTLDCQSCHNPIQFCATCHQQAGVSPRPGPREFGRISGQRRFHPPGFVGAVGEPRSAQHHATAARRNLQSCVSCHTENDCVRCHSAGAPSSLRATPHPPGFRCDGIIDVNLSGCLKCHQDRSTLLTLCVGR